MKIISLVPSMTETLFDFGLSEKEIIGRTKFCNHPALRFKNVDIIRGPKNLNLEKIKDLKPDLIIANKEENDKEQIAELMQNFNVWVTEIDHLNDNRTFLTELGLRLNKEDTTKEFNQKIDEIFSEISTAKKFSATYLIWKNPYMTIGSDTFIHDVLEKIGFENRFGNQTRYPKISVDDMIGSGFILLYTEPFPFKQKNIEELRKEIPQSEFLIVDGEAFSWSGTHLAKCGNYYRELQKKIYKIFPTSPQSHSSISRSSAVKGSSV